jgi:hypothetical protein
MKKKQINNCDVGFFFLKRRKKFQELGLKMLLFLISKIHFSAGDIMQ